MFTAYYVAYITFLDHIMMKLEYILILFDTLTDIYQNQMKGNLKMIMIFFCINPSSTKDTLYSGSDRLPFVIIKKNYKFCMKTLFIYGCLGIDHDVSFSAAARLLRCRALSLRGLVPGVSTFLSFVDSGVLTFRSLKNEEKESGTTWNGLEKIVHVKDKRN